jgi:hypothetical protein
LEKILLTLDEDRALGVFFEAIPGFCDSDLVQKPLDDGFRANLQRSLVGFLDRTFASTSVPQQVRNDRLITCLNAANSALGPRAVFQILHDFSKVHSDEELQSIVREHYWVNKGNGRRIAAYTIACTQNRGFEWTRLVTEVLGVPEDVFRMYRTEGDGPLLAILIHVTRKTLRTGHLERGVLESLSQFDVRYTPPYLQREFCTLWNEVVQEERNLKASGVPTQIIFAIRHLFTKLHPDTDAVLAPLPVFSGSIDRLQVDPTLSQRSSESYPLCPHPGHCIPSIHRSCRPT